jgi:hypothetical protein
VNALYDNVDVTAKVREALPPKTQALAPVAAGALRQFSERAANRLPASPRAQNACEQVNRRASENLVAVLDGKDVRRFSTAKGNVPHPLAPWFSGSIAEIE